MSQLPKEWRFLRAAWVYALVVTGRSHAATELVSSTLGTLVGRQDIASPKRLKRLFFASLRRESFKPEQISEEEFAGDRGLWAMHQLSEPGRSALLFLHLRIFPTDQLADVLGKSENELPEILSTARAELATKLTPAL
jgi:DNA-directed RNA polymerase specialized sigma24 family protein